MTKYLLIALLFVGAAASCQPDDGQKKLPKGETYDPPGSTDTRSKAISFQERKTFKIDDIYVSNEFYGGRLHHVKRNNNKKNGLIITIKPENKPINKSAWFAFRIWSDTEKKVIISLRYKDGEHRYTPKISSDGTNWESINKSDYKHFKKSGTAEIKVDIGPNSTWVAAQELQTSRHIFEWMDSLEKQSYIDGDTAGYSTLNTPVRVLKIGKNDAKNAIILFSRQHPPEVTGQIAADAFMETLLDSTDLANRFRANFRIYAFPLINPDGVDQGHWRHNAGGVDLNRDWKYFNQPEVRSVTTYLVDTIKSKDVKVWYGIDFHSTRKDILYPISNKIIPKSTSITQKWIKGMNNRLPNDKWTVEPFDISSPIAKNWIYKTFDAEAMTYEVGDDTPRDYVRLKSKVAAETLMSILLDRAE